MQGVVNKGIVLAVTQTLREDITLQLGDTAETVSVVADIATVETDSAALGTAIRQEIRDNLPLKGRSSLFMFTLTPGVVNNRYGEDTRPNDTITNIFFSANGAPGAATDVFVDGAANTVNVNRGPRGDGGAPAQRRRAGRSRPVGPGPRKVTMQDVSRLILAGMALVLAACASPPPTLLALPAATAPSQRPPTDTAATVRMRHVHVAEYLDGFPVVVGRDGQMLVVADRTEWAERPSQGMSRVLRDALSQRLGPGQLLIAGDGRRADADLSVELLALDPARNTLALDATWSVACRAAGHSHGGRTAVRVEMSAATPQAVAVATSEALSRLADAVVADLRCDGLN